MSVLYFTVFAGVESIPPCTSDLGVTIQIGFRYAQHGGDGGVQGKCFSLMCRRAHCVVTRFQNWHDPSVERNWQERDVSLTTSCTKDNLNQLPFSPWRIHARFLGESLPMCMEVRSGLYKGCTKAHCSSNNRRDKTTRNYNLFKSTVQLILGDVCWIKVNLFQGERKIDGWWDEEDYEIARQVANGSSSYETKSLSGRVEAPHRNRFFQVATLWGASTALCHNECANVDLTTRSALMESTPLECNTDLPRNNVEERLSQCSTSLSLCGQVDGIWRSLYEVVPSTAMKDYRDRRRGKCACDDKPHWVPLVYFQACHLNPNFHFEHKQNGGKDVMGVLMPGPGLVSLLSWSKLGPR